VRERIREHVRREALERTSHITAPPPSDVANVMSGSGSAHPYTLGTTVGVRSAATSF